MRGPVGMQEGSRDVVLQLNNREPQGRHSQRFGAVHRAVPLKLASGGHAELVGEVPALVMVLAMLVLVKGQGVCAVLVVIDTELALLTELEEPTVRAALSSQVLPEGAVGHQRRSLREESQN